MKIMVYWTQSNENAIVWKERGKAYEKRKKNVVLDFDDGIADRDAVRVCSC